MYWFVRVVECEQLSPPGVCAINGLLYVIGGDDGSCNLSSVEFYNPATDKWSLIPTNMSNGRSYAGKFWWQSTEKYSLPVHVAVSCTQSFVFSLLQASQWLTSRYDRGLPAASALRRRPISQRLTLTPEARQANWEVTLSGRNALSPRLS